MISLTVTVGVCSLVPLMRPPPRAAQFSSRSAVCRMQEPPEAPPETDARAGVHRLRLQLVDAASRRRTTGSTAAGDQEAAGRCSWRSARTPTTSGAHAQVHGPAPGPNEPIVVEGEGSDDVGALAPIDVEATASLTTATDRELQGDFLSFLAEREADEVFKETDGGEIVFSSREQLAGLVSQFAYDKLKELSAAARALARYVEDLENELEAADDTAVAMRKEVLESERARPVGERGRAAPTAGRPRRRAPAARAAIAREQEAQAEAEAAPTSPPSSSWPPRSTRRRRRARRRTTLKASASSSAKSSGGGGARDGSGEGGGARQDGAAAHGGDGGGVRQTPSLLQATSTSSRRSGTPPRRCDACAIRRNSGAILAQFGAIL